VKLYIAGPITGVDNHQVNFDKAATTLVERGFEVANPCWLDDQGAACGWGWEDYMKATLTMMLACDGVALIEGWERSKGAALEIQVANGVGMPVHDVTAWLS